jgi:cation diffusion facilitator family transporter
MKSKETNDVGHIYKDSVILLLISAFLAFEAIHQLVEAAHHSDHSDHVAFVGIAGVVVNFFGLRLISPLIGGWGALAKRLTSQQEETNGSRLLNLEAVALHIVFDIVSSLGVIISSILGGLGFPAADPIVAVLIAALTARGATPMFKRTARMLAQGASVGFRPEPLLRELSAVDGVLEFYQAHFWTLAPCRDVGSLIIRVRADADEDYILKQAHRIFASSLWSLTCQIEREKQINALPSIKPVYMMQPNGSESIAQSDHSFIAVRTGPADNMVGLKEAAHIL